MRADTKIIAFAFAAGFAFFTIGAIAELVDRVQHLEAKIFLLENR